MANPRFVLVLALQCTSSLAYASVHLNLSARSAFLVCIDGAAMGLTPTMGLTFALGRLRGSLGAFLALTGHELKGADLV